MIHVKKWIISPTEHIYKVAGVGESPTSNCDNSCTGLLWIFPFTFTIADLIFPSLPAINSDTLPTFQVHRTLWLEATITKSPSLMVRFSLIAGPTPRLLR